MGSRKLEIGRGVGSRRRRFEGLAEEHGFLLVYAEAWARGGLFGRAPEWNDCRKNTDLPAHNQNVDDVGFLTTLLDRLLAERAVDPRRVYASGLSDGGRLATEHPDRFAAVAILVAQQAAPQNSNCLEPRGPIPVLVMNQPRHPRGGRDLGLLLPPRPRGRRGIRRINIQS